MGANFYIFGVLVVLVLLGSGFYLWYRRNKDAILQCMTEWLCYQFVSELEYIKPGEYDHHRMALDYAIKHNKKTTWKVID